MQTHIKFLEHQYNQAYKELDFETAEEFYRIKEILIDLNEKAGQVEPEVMQKPKPKTLQAIFEIIDNVDFELARLEDIAKGEIGDKITLLRKYIDENRVSA